MTRIMPIIGVIALLGGCGPEKSPVKAQGMKIKPSLETTLYYEEELERKTSLLEEKYHLSLSYDRDVRGISPFLERIDEVLSEIHPSLLNYLQQIEISNKPCNETAGNWCEGGLPIYTETKTGRIQISPRRPFDSDLLAHTLAHIITAVNPVIQKEWDSMIEIDPRSGVYQAIRDNTTPTRGFLSASGIQVFYDPKSMKPTWTEDLAEYLSAMYLSDSPFRKVESHQGSYFKKLDLLIDYDLISATQYNNANLELQKEITRVP